LKRDRPAPLSISPAYDFSVAVGQITGEKIVSIFYRIVNIIRHVLLNKNYSSDRLWKTSRNSVENNGKICIEPQNKRGKLN
jgi:hypothetical protein